ncbi:MAG TPA: cysteine hydrolase family protein [Gemmatimonas sp.]|uniref:cysteine hydrolase family protein n=1 Tax=Gemmatimonas sp. TaxID=1962908 RepID=UPI002ED9F026
MSRQALVVIDVQRALCEGPEAAFEADTVIARIDALASRARVAGTPVIFVQHQGTNGYLEYGTEGWALPPALRTADGDHFVGKTTPDAFNRTPLADLLTTLEVQELVVCGMHTEFCVDTSVRRALAHGYPVLLASDAHTSNGNEHLSAPQVIAHHNITLSNVTSFGPRVRLAPAAAITFSA